jgi:hypothetical protein
MQSYARYEPILFYCEKGKLLNYMVFFFFSFFRVKGFQKRICPTTGFMYTMKLSLTSSKGLNKLCPYKGVLL